MGEVAQELLECVWPGELAGEIEKIQELLLIVWKLGVRIGGGLVGVADCWTGKRE